MKYKLAEKHIQTGDLLVCSGPWFMSRAIRYITDSDVSHVGIAAWVSFNGGPRTLCMFEAMEGKDIRFVPLEATLKADYWPKGGKIWWKKLVDDSISGPSIIDFCVSNWSDNYADVRQFLVILFPYIRKLLHINMDTNPEAFHCSELVAASVKQQGFKSGKDPAITTPADVDKYDIYGERMLLQP